MSLAKSLLYLHYILYLFGQGKFISITKKPWNFENLCLNHADGSKMVFFFIPTSCLFDLH